MNREQLTHYKKTIRELRDRLRDPAETPVGPAAIEILVTCVDELATIVGGFISERLEEGEHAAEVAKIMNPRSQGDGHAEPDPRD